MAFSEERYDIGMQALQKFVMPQIEMFGYEIHGSLRKSVQDLHYITDGVITDDTGQTKILFEHKHGKNDETTTLVVRYKQKKWPTSDFDKIISNHPKILARLPRLWFVRTYGSVDHGSGNITWVSGKDVFDWCNKNKERVMKSFKEKDETLFTLKIEDWFLLIPLSELKVEKIPPCLTNS